jgi:hypothetical protein
VTPVEAALLNATPQGNTVLAGSRPVFELLDEQAVQLEARRRPLTGEVLKRRLSTLLTLPPWQRARVGVPHYRVPRAVTTGGKAMARYAVETERDLRAILKKRLANPDLSHTLDVEPEVHLLLPHVSSEEDLAGDPWAQGLNSGGALYALDVRGLGESMPEPHGSAGFFQPYGMDYMLHGHGILFGESYLGRRVFDVLRTLELLCANGAERVHLYGRGQGALLALFAGVLHPQVGHIVMRNGPTSYRDWVSAPLVAWPAASFLRGVLVSFDLPDVMRLVSGRLTISEPWGPDMKALG